MLQFKKAARNSCKIKMALQGASGSGKSYSALLLAYGLTSDWSKIAVLDTENGSAHLYSDLGDYSVLNLTKPFTPEKYMEAIDAAVENGFECLIIDSISAEWNGAGGILDIHSSIPGNSFTAWAKVTPRHHNFLQKLLQSDIHVIATMRTKIDYVMNDKNGKVVPEKVGLKAVQRDDVEYEFTVVFELNQNHIATTSKDRTGLFTDMPGAVLNSEIGEEIQAWCNLGVIEDKPAVEIEPKKEKQFTQRIQDCKTMEELVNLYQENPENQKQYRNSFMKKEEQIKTPA